MQFTLVKNDYLNDIRLGRALSSATFSTYQSWLNRYERWLETEGYSAPDTNQALSVSVLRKYLYGLSAMKLRPRTLRAAFHPLRGLCAFLIEQGFMTEAANPMKKLTLPKKDAAKRLLVEDSEVAALFDAAERQVNPQKIAFSRSILAALCFTGIRATELVDLKLSDISIESKTLLVAAGKGSKSRTLYPPQQFFTAYKEWLIERAKIKPAHNYVWTQGSNRRISDDWLRRHLEEIKAIAGFKGSENIKPHSLRHWFATKLMRNGATIKQVQAALGHTDVKTTAIYLHVNEDDCRAMATLAAFDIEKKSPPASSKPLVGENNKSAKAVKDKAVSTNAFMMRRRNARR